MSLVEEHIVLSLIADMGTKTTPHHTMPVAPVFLIKLLLDVLRHHVLDFEVVDCVFGLSRTLTTSFMARAIISDPSGISMMFSLRGCSPMVCNLNQ